jgi:hypothetical protein
MARATARKVEAQAPDDQRRVKRLQQELDLPPSTGRATKLGKKVEKPAEPPAGGPSGQKIGVRHDRKHTNK